MTYYVNMFILLLIPIVKEEDNMYQQAVICAVCISERKGELKHPVDMITLRPCQGIVGTGR